MVARCTGTVTTSLQFGSRLATTPGPGLSCSVPCWDDPVLGRSLGDGDERSFVETISS